MKMHRWRSLMLLLLIYWQLGCTPSTVVTSSEQLSTPSARAAVPIAAPTSEATPEPAALADADWPQLARDPQRSGASPQTISGPYRFYWRWSEVPIASRVQPVVAENRLFIGGLNGMLYALDAAYDAQGGSPHILWTRDLGSPIRAGAGVDGATVIVGTHNGTIYGIDAVSGQQRWKLATDGAILAAPLVATGVVYLCSADGWCYAIRTSDGALLWKASLDAPILSSAALSGDEHRLFIVAENAKAYALDSNTGAVLWQTQLQGQGAADRWPVVLGNMVIFRTQPLRFFHDLLHEGDNTMDSAGARLADWDADWVLIRPKIVAKLAAQPSDQTFFALDAQTGHSLGVAPVLYTFGNNDAPAPPVAYQQSLYLPYRARHGIQTDGGATHVTSRYDAELGRMVPQSLDISGLSSSDPFTYQFRLTSDEPATLSIAGDLLLVDNWERLGGIRLSNSTLVGIAQVAHDYPTCNVQCEANDTLMPFYTGYPFPGPSVGEGRVHAGVAVAAGRIFWHVANSGLAAIGTAMDLSVPPAEPARLKAQSPAPPAVLALPGPRHVSSQVLSAYVWNETPRPLAAPASLLDHLDREIGRIVATNEHLLPFYLERGFHGIGSWPPDTTNPPGPTSIAFARAYWYDPGELLLTLSTAYPYLSTSRQVQLRAYIQAEMKRYPPLSDLLYSPPDWLTKGRPREPYPVPSRTDWNIWPPPSTPIQTLYALWAYARYLDDWSYLNTHWSDIKALFDARKTAVDSYAKIAGAIGYARIAKALGHTSEASEGEAVAVAAMQSGLNFAQWLDRANNLFPDPRDLRTGQRGQVFFGLTPEIGAYLRDTNAPAVQSYLDQLIGYPDGAYLWYATRLGLQTEAGESSYQTPELAWSVFLAQAYVMRANQSQLCRWIDRPWGLGDVWHVQKLLAAIEAAAPGPILPYRMFLPVVAGTGAPVQGYC